MLRKIISGGQTGADVGGLRAAKKLGIETGGMIPRGFRTFAGCRPEYAKLYGLEETSSSEYPPRTIANVRSSDGTIRFAANFQSAGELCTLKAIRKCKKPYFDVDIMKAPPVSDVSKWITENNIQTLNIAGNREETCEGIESFVESYLCEVIVLLRLSVLAPLPASASMTQ